MALKKNYNYFGIFGILDIWERTSQKVKKFNCVKMRMLRDFGNPVGILYNI